MQKTRAEIWNAYQKDIEEAVKKREADEEKLLRTLPIIPPEEAHRVLNETIIKIHKAYEVRATEAKEKALKAFRLGEGDNLTNEE